MNCWHCNAKLIWGGDHDYEDYDRGGEGVVSNLSCPECDAFVLVYMPIKERRSYGKKKND